MVLQHEIRGESGGELPPVPQRRGRSEGLKRVPGEGADSGLARGKARVQLLERGVEVTRVERDRRATCSLGVRLEYLEERHLARPREAAASVVADAIESQPLAARREQHARADDSGFEEGAHPGEHRAGIELEMHQGAAVDAPEMRGKERAERLPVVR